MFSNGSPVNLSLSQAFVAKYDLIHGTSCYGSHPLKARLTYFSRADEKDVQFVRKCLKETRFKEK
jgi:hypothetical protein